MPASTKVGGTTYNFQQWSDGDTSLTKTISVLADTSITATFLAQSYSLTINSTPSGVPFQIAGVPLALTTPFGPIQEPVHQYTITMPDPVSVGGSSYKFQGWSDGVTTATRTINFVANTILQANYLLIIQTSVLTVQSSFPITFFLDGTLQGTPFTGTLTDGSHTIVVPSIVQSGGVTYNLQWENGSTNPTRVINLTANMTIQAIYTVLTWNLQILSSGLSPVQFTLNGMMLSTPYNANLAPGQYVLAVPSSITLLPPATSFGTYDFQNWLDGVTTPSRAFTLDRNLVLTANFAQLLSWNPHVPFGPVRTTLEQILGLQVSSQGGATLAGGWPWPLNPNGTDPNFDIKRNWNAPGKALSLAGVLGPTFVQIDSVVCSAFQHTPTTAPVTEDSSVRYTSINGGALFPPNPTPTGDETSTTWGDTTVNLQTGGLPFPPGATCDLTDKRTCQHVIHVEIDRDWKASGRAGPANNCDWLAFLNLPPITNQNRLIDVQGFVYWDDQHTTIPYHSFSGWEIHPLTAFRLH